MSKPISSNTLYFAYGSNLCRNQMAVRCPGASISGPAILVGHRFVINLRGHATIVPQPDRRVHGLLWHLSAENETALDRYESVELNHYSKIKVRVELPDQRVAEAMAYLAADATPGVPLEPYLSGILQAARVIGFPALYIDELAGWARS